MYIVRESAVLRVPVAAGRRVDMALRSDGSEAHETTKHLYQI